MDRATDSVMGQFRQEFPVGHNIEGLGEVQDFYVELGVVVMVVGQVSGGGKELGDT